MVTPKQDGGAQTPLQWAWSRGKSVTLAGVLGFTTMTTVTIPIRRVSLAALALVAIAAPAAYAANADRPNYPQDDNIWGTSVPAGQTEHGVWTAGNVNDPHD